MSNETDLDWLARNVHVWPDIVPGRSFAAALVWNGEAELIECPPVDWSGCYNKHQWLARRAELQQFTSIEDNQELNMSDKQEVKQDNGWFERGELPPVGVVCETLAEPELQWVSAEVVAHRDGFAIVWVTSEKCGAQCDDPKHFRPIRTERELAIEGMMGHCKFMGSRDFAGSLFDAGYRKESK